MRHTVFSIFARSTVLVAPPSIALGQNARPYDGHMMDWGQGMFFGPFGWIAWLVIAAIIIAVVLGLSGGRKNRETTNQEALRILKNRYASGEIDKQQYEDMRRDLER